MKLAVSFSNSNNGHNNNIRNSNLRISNIRSSNITPDFIRHLLGIKNTPLFVWDIPHFYAASRFIKGIAGIYGIYCIKSARLYIGSAYNLYKRISSHLSTPARSNIILQRALRKYGIGNFKIIIFQTLNIMDPNLKQLLIDAENYYLNTIPKPMQYNILESAYTSLGFKHTDNTKALIRVKALGRIVSEDTKRKLSERNRGVGNPFYGKTHDEDTRKRISMAVLHHNKHRTTMPVYSPEFLYQQTKNKSEANNHMSKVVIVTNHITNEVSEFPTITAAANFLKAQRKSVSEACKHKRLLKGTWSIVPKV